VAQKFRKVDPRIWYDEKFRTLSAADKLLAVYLLTGSQTNRIGLFYVSLSLAAEQTGYPPDTLAIGIRRVCHTLRWVFDEASGVLFLPTWWKYNGVCGPRTMAGNLGDLHDVPQTHLIEQFANNNRYLTDAEFEVVRRVCHTHAIPMPYPSAIGAQEQEQEQEQKQEKKEPPIPPASGGRRRRARDVSLHPLFEEFWTAYPRHEGRQAAVRAFAKIDPDAAQLAAMLDAVARQRDRGCLEPRFTGDGRSTIPHAATWLNGRRWEDEPPPAATPSATPSANGHARKSGREQVEEVFEQYRRGEYDG
jgi:hypothetical protein